jgi:hypothetical protein
MSPMAVGALVAFIVAGVVVGGIAAVVLGNQNVGPAATLAPPASRAASPGTSAGSSGPSAAIGPPVRTFAPGGLHAVVDASLLSVLPTTVAGLPVTEFPEAETQAITDPDLGRNVSRVATAFVGDAAGENWAYTSVVEVRPESRSDSFYRDWQESFDASACEQAGGVTGHTTITIAGRTVERTACGGGVRTYHVRIAGTGLLISVSDVGAAGFAEQELNALRT